MLFFPLCRWGNRKCRQSRSTLGSLIRICPLTAHPQHPLYAALTGTFSSTPGIHVWSFWATFISQIWTTCKTGSIKWLADFEYDRLQAMLGLSRRPLAFLGYKATCNKDKSQACKWQVTFLYSVRVEDISGCSRDCFSSSLNQLAIMIQIGKTFFRLY